MAVPKILKTRKWNIGIRTASLLSSGKLWSHCPHKWSQLFFYKVRPSTKSRTKSTYKHRFLSKIFGSLSYFRKNFTTSFIAVIWSSVLCNFYILRSQALSSLTLGLIWKLPKASFQTLSPLYPVWPELVESWKRKFLFPPRLSNYRKLDCRLLRVVISKVYFWGTMIDSRLRQRILQYPWDVQKWLCKCLGLLNSFQKSKRSSQIFPHTALPVLWLMKVHSLFHCLLFEMENLHPFLFFLLNLLISKTSFSTKIIRLSEEMELILESNVGIPIIIWAEWNFLF